MSTKTSKQNAPATNDDSELLLSVTPEQVSDAIKTVGCAVNTVEQDGVVRLHSASHGVGFQVFWGNATTPGHYVDFTLSCPLRVQGGTLPEGIVAAWHRTKRFARVSQHGDFVVLEMDIVLAGGVSPSHLSFSLQLWTQMMGQFLLHLRNYVPESPDATGAQNVDGTQDTPITDAETVKTSATEEYSN